MPPTPFQAPLQIIGINPYVDVPSDILNQIFTQAGKTKGQIPIRGLINGQAYTQTLVRYQGAWRLYVNMLMLKDSPRRVGETLTLTAEYDPEPRTIPATPAFTQALAQDPIAQTAFTALSPSRQHEIVRYLSRLKSPQALTRNIELAIRHLQGQARFAGRDPD